MIVVYLFRAGFGIWRVCFFEGWLIFIFDFYEVKEGGGCWLGKAVLGLVLVDIFRGGLVKVVFLRSLVDAVSFRFRLVGFLVIRGFFRSWVFGRVEYFILDKWKAS